MVTRRAGFLKLVVALLCGPALAAAQGMRPTGCATSPAPGMVAFDTARVATLVGTFDLVMYDTTSLSGVARQHNGRLTLWLQDSLPRRRNSMIRPVQSRYLVGSFEAAAHDSSDMFAKMAGKTHEDPGVFWTDGFFRLGEFGPKNGISLHVRTVAADELRGMWTTNAGTAIIVDFTGDREPDEAGYFCAKRVK
jgi:hypothetical protein